MRAHKNTSNYVKITRLFIVFAAIFFISPVYADSFTVTNYNSSGAGSLSAAIDALNTSATSGSIEFNEGSSSGTIDLSGYTTSLGYETVFDLNSYNVTLENYVGGCGSWTKFNGDTGGVLNIGSGSTWSNNWGIVIGDGTTGSLTVSNGGDFSVSNGGTYVGSTSGDANGSLTVTGSGSTYADSNNVYIGYSGTGSLNVSDGGTMTASKDVYAGYNSGSTALLPLPAPIHRSRGAICISAMTGT
jgi:T5SS/PEP-CTERM-associated repeat protein